MLKYEERLHFDERYRKLQSGGFLQAAIAVFWGITGYALLYCLFRSVFALIPDEQPWNRFGIWLTVGGVRLLKSDLVYFLWGLFITVYGTVRLTRITIQNHSARKKESSTPDKLLTTGDYARVRHPMYGTFILLQAGFLLSLRSLLGIILALIVVGVQYLNAGMEEKKRLVPLFGDAYRVYKKKVRRMLLTRPELTVILSALLISAAGYIV